MKDSLQNQGTVKLQGAMGDQDTIAKCARNVSIQIEEDKAKWNVYVADICKDFIPDLDFMLHFGTRIDLGDYTFLFKNNVIPSNYAKRTMANIR